MWCPLSKKKALFQTAQTPHPNTVSYNSSSGELFPRKKWNIESRRYRETLRLWRGDFFGRRKFDAAATLSRQPRSRCCSANGYCCFLVISDWSLTFTGNWAVVQMIIWYGYLVES